MAITIRRDNDPFKKYWWVILAGFGLVGCWVCLPLMEAGTGSGAVSKEQGLKSAEQSLDSVNNPTGAPGSAVNLSMDGSGAYRKKTDGPITSSLYQPPPEPEAAPEAPKPAEAKGSLADALKNVAKKSASAAVDPTGWGGAKAQKGFTGPKANLGAMSGLGGGSSGSGASSGGGGGSGGGSGLSAFGAATAKTGTSFARGLRPEAPESKGGSKSMKVLEAAQSASVAAASQKSNDAASAMSAQSFDGGGRGGGGIGGPGGASVGGGGGVYGSMDAAPINLKVNDPNLNQMKFTPPPADKKEEKDPNDEMRKKIMELLITALIGGLVGGVVSGVLGAAGLDGDKKDKDDDDSALPRVWDVMYAAHCRRPYGFTAA